MRLLELVMLVGLASRGSTGALSTTNEVEDGCEDVEECEYVEEKECGVCHSIFIRECNIKMEFTHKPIKVNECREFECSELGYTRKCYTKYSTQCTSSLVYQDMQEDHPVCGISKQERCSGSGCSIVPVMKCKIEKKLTRKAQPETSCSRVPSQVCGKEKCERRRCYDRVVMSKEMHPVEECEYKERRMCQETEDTSCHTTRRKLCRKKPCRPVLTPAPGLEDSLTALTPAPGLQDSLTVRQTLKEKNLNRENSLAP